MPETDVLNQRAYYARTAEHYDAMHVDAQDEHGLALSMFSGVAQDMRARSVLDVGAGTGRGLEVLRRNLPDARIVGVEPVAELRAIGHARGVPDDVLIEGDALALNFPDDSFDFVIETGVLHHIREPARAVAEMLRVARLGVMISDSNKFGQGSLPVRAAKRAIAGAGLWNAYIWLQTRGRMAKWSEGDGVFYSYSVYDNLDQVRRKFPRTLIANTVNSPSSDPRFGASQVCLIALRA